MARINGRLKVRRADEALLYQAEKKNSGVGVCEDIMCLQAEAGENLGARPVEELWQEVYEECYLLSRYKEILFQWDKFDFLAGNIIKKAEICDRKQDAVAWMEQMLLRGKDYLWMEEAGCPVLLYKGDDPCYNVLDTFVEQFREAFLRAGQEVEIFDIDEEGIQGLTRLMGRHFRAVIGMQTYLFGVKMEDGSFLHEYIKGPKYNVIFDHPVWMKNHLENVPENFYALTHDMHYVTFIEEYYQIKAYFLPPAGNEVKLEKLPKEYEISFIGSYRDYWSEVMLIHTLPRKTRFIANHFLLEMRKHPHYTPEKALAEVYRKREVEPVKEDFFTMLWELRRVCYCVIHYYRYHVIKELLDAGVQVDVFGDTWQICPLREYPNLRCHPTTDYDENILIWQKSKLSLNIMSWHKGGFTERMANIMLCRTALVTDDTTYLHGKFIPDEDVVVFRLDELDKLPGKVKEYLNNDGRRQKLAENGWRKACEHETWDTRVRAIEEILS